ncbi:glucose-1-phosphate adenylyltransferase family protein [Rhodobacter sp. SY28-1]|uniref:glucose-1-phosphate adenylyltransferase family protein n=1 Tax=Rhodobacter sp. SY28-1 TaxID=2562317 RepID=UPI0010BFF0E1|nr:sugar phosphate nucleotidyltransferase [Rhodobacter sp. SY28-1]
MFEDVDLSGTMAVVLAGGQGSRLHELTQRDCKPALPFTRFHRIVDFAMAGLQRSGVGRTILATQYCPANLNSHIMSTWGQSVADGKLMLRHGPDVAPGQGYRGTADVLRANAALLDEMGAREILILAADHVYSMDYRHLVASHRQSGAAVTLAAMPVPIADAGRFGIVTPGPDGRIARFAEKPAIPESIPGEPELSLASLGIYVADWPWLKAALQDPQQQDFGMDVIPHAVAQGDAAAFRWSGYWRDVGTLDALRESWLDFDTGPTPCRRPLVPGMSLPDLDHFLARDRFRARVTMGGLKLMSPLLGSADTVRWAALDRSILMPGAQIGPGVRLTNVIVGPGAIIADGIQIGEDPDEDRRWFRIAGDTTLVTVAMLARRGALRPRSHSILALKPGLFRSRMRTS